ncbi:hypothetical protein QSV34_10790 [Porticoccus sp. W117]|uniref:hypothetical protein n=1 Tax=Porticoccus sp. W117 TaxID=3054777 RepID=UPI0025974FFA|nr:hypothetical protein [Porticoccus sp. W117]MDM3871836.1 hypothetical protein [Porticoccus sp. W117]
MVRNYYIKNKLYKGSRLSQEKFERLLFPILIGTPIASIAKDNDISEYTVRMISNKLREKLSTESIWMNEILKSYKERHNLLHMKLSTAPRLITEYLSEAAANIFSNYYYSNVYPNTHAPSPTSENRNNKNHRQDREDLEKMIDNKQRIDTCLHNCSTSPNLREIRSEYGDVDSGKILQHFQRGNYIKQLEKRKSEWDHHIDLDKFMKLPIKSLDVRMDAKFQLCQYCPAAGLKQLKPQDWLFLSNYEKHIKKLRNDERYMGLFFMSMMLPTIVSLYVLMIKQAKSYLRSNKDEESLRYTKEWMEKFLSSMNSLETDIVTATKRTLFVSPLSNTRPKNSG